MFGKFNNKRGERKPSMRLRLFLGLGAVGAILLLSSVISILEYRRMSNYVSDMIASNIRSINFSQKLADMTQEYDQQMLTAVLMDDISLMPDFNPDLFRAQADSLKNSITSKRSLPLVDSVVSSFDAFMNTSLKFDEVFLADTVNNGEWFFGTLQPRYVQFRQDINNLDAEIHDALRSDSRNFDDGFYRGLMPGVVSVGAGVLLVLLLMYFIMAYYVRPIYHISDGIDNYRSMGRRHSYTFDGDDQIANINSGVTELTEENIELKRRVKALREDRERLLGNEC